MLKKLHWLPVEHRTVYKLCLYMHYVHTGHKPQYLTNHVTGFLLLGAVMVLDLAMHTMYYREHGLNLESLAFVSLVQLPGIDFLLTYIISLTQNSSRNCSRQYYLIVLIIVSNVIMFSYYTALLDI